MEPLCIDLFCGLGGWAEGFLAEGYRVVGFDIERHDYGRGGYPGQLVLQDALTLHGSQFRGAACIVASPPCQEFSYLAMPWSRAKQIGKALRRERDAHGKMVDFPEGYTGSRTVEQMTALFDACFRIQREACEAASRYIPLIVENVKGAQPWVGPAKAHFGSFYLWGDVAMVGNRVVSSVPVFGRWTRPIGRPKKGRSNFHFYEQTGLPSPSFHGAEHEPSVQRAEAIKSAGSCAPRMWKDRDFGGDSAFHQERRNEHEKTGKPGRSFQSAAVAQKVPLYSDPRRNGGKGVHLTSPRENQDGVKRMSGLHGLSHPDGNGKRDLGGPNDPRRFSSKSNSRKAASAEIAKIPFELASYIARSYNTSAVN